MVWKRIGWLILIVTVGCGGLPAAGSSVASVGTATRPAPAIANPATVVAPAGAASAPATATPTAAATLRPGDTTGLRFDGKLAYQVALDQCAIGPRPPGSAALQQTRDYIIRHLRDTGWTVETQPFTYQGAALANIVGKRGQGPVTILGAHFDTRPIADKDPDVAQRDKPILGGNDGASGVAVLLELARVWKDSPPPGETWLAFFDGEDSGDIKGWTWAVGSSHMAANLSVTPKQMILVDMIGDADQQIYLETTSNQALLHRLFDVAHELGYSQWFIRVPRHGVWDDHTAFLQRGIPAADLIDFDYPYHHTLADDCGKVAPASLERVGRVLELFMRRGG